MPVSTEKTILFARAVDGKVTHQWPVAVFNQPSGARSYVSMLKVAYAADSLEAIKALDPAHKQDAEGKHLTGVKYSLVTVPYQPSPAFGDDDTEEVAAS